MAGKFIVFDGIDGAGKTETAKAVVSFLKEAGRQAIYTREPGGSPFAEEIRALMVGPSAAQTDAKVMFGLSWASRRDHMINTVVPALERGSDVVCDRFDSSALAYQIYGPQVDELRPLFYIMRKMYIPVFPDVYIFLDVPAEVGIARAEARGGNYNHFDQRDAAFHSRLRQGFLDFAQELPPEQSIVIDANKSREEVWADVKKAVQSVI